MFFFFRTIYKLLAESNSLANHFTASENCARHASAQFDAHTHTRTTTTHTQTTLICHSPIKKHFNNIQSQRTHTHAQRQSANNLTNANSMKNNQVKSPNAKINNSVRNRHTYTYIAYIVVACHTTITYHIIARQHPSLFSGALIK